MKAFTNLRKKIKQKPKLAFVCTTAGFYLMMLVLYGYLMLGNLSSAPKFVYAQF